MDGKFTKIMNLSIVNTIINIILLRERYDESGLFIFR